MNYSKYDEGFKKGYREGVAIASFEIMENVIKHEFKDDYELINFKIRRISEYEARLLIDEYFYDKEIKSLYEVI